MARSDPDGYTLVTSSSSMATESVLHSKLPYDPVKDFVPVVLLGTSPNILVASVKSGFKTVADLVAAAKAKPGTLTFASAGIGSSSHMAAERFRLAAKIDVRHVPFKEGGLVQVMNGNIDFYFIPLAAAASALHSDKLTILAVSAPKRVPLLPNVPSVVEAGYPGAVFRFWNGISAPAKTPPDVVKKFHDVTEQALKMPAVQEKLAKLGVEPAQISSEEFAKFFKDDFDATVRSRQESQHQSGRSELTRRSNGPHSSSLEPIMTSSAAHRPAAVGGRAHQARPVAALRQYARHALLPRRGVGAVLQGRIRAPLSRAARRKCASTNSTC